METFLVITLGKKGEIEDIKLIIPQEKFIVKPKYMNRLLMKKLKKKKNLLFYFSKNKTEHEQETLSNENNPTESSTK